MKEKVDLNGLRRKFFMISTGRKIAMQKWIRKLDLNCERGDDDHGGLKEDFFKLTDSEKIRFKEWLSKLEIRKK